MFEQDYIMRLIKEMVRAILRLLFHINTDSPTAEILDEKEEKKQLEGLLFYSYLNDKTDDFLTEHDFTREEVLQGLGSWTASYGLEGISELFLQ